MTNPLIQIDHAALKAASRIMARNDIRYYLNGVYVEATPTETIIAATDGHRLLALHAYAENEVQEAATLIIPGEVVKRIVDGSLKTVRQVSLTQASDDKWTVPLHQWGVDLTFRSVEGIFPDWRKVIPAKASGQHANINPEYLAAFQAAAYDLCGKPGRRARVPTGIEVRPNGTGGALVFAPSSHTIGFIGVVMPLMTETNPRSEPPAWALTPEPKLVASRRGLLAAKTLPAPQPAEAQA
ncbi:hypothetical protein ACOTF3_04305 [Achromobacter xylosoxidans]